MTSKSPYNNIPPPPKPNKPPIKEWVCELCSSKQSTVLYLCKKCGNPQFGKKEKEKKK